MKDLFWLSRRLTPARLARDFQRIAHARYARGHGGQALILTRFASLLTGIEIGGGVTFGQHFLLVNGYGTVIANGVVVGDDCVIFQGVTIGRAHPGGPLPQIGNRVRIGCGAVVIGEVTVGDDAEIGANAVVTKDVPAGATVVGAPARVIKVRDERTEARSTHAVAS